MSNRIPATLVALALFFAPPAVARAQSRPVTPAQPTPAEAVSPDSGFEHSPRRPDAMVTLSFENADLPELVRTISEMTGKRFVVASNPKSFQATVVSPQRVTVGEAYQVFLSVLAANHLTVVPHGRFLKIVDAQDSAHLAPVHSSVDGAPAEERFITFVHRVAHVSADDVATGVLSKLASHDGAVIAYGNVLLITDTASNVQRLMRVLDEIDVAQAEDKVWLEPLQYVLSTDVKKELDDLLDAKKDGDKAAKGAAPGAGGEARVTKIVALQRPNALLIVGARGGYERLLELIRSIDVAAPDEGQMHVVMLEHADAKKIVGAINEAVAAASGASPGGAGVATSRVLEAPVKVSAEETTNALIVTASAHDFAAVREVIRKLDQPRRQVYIEAVVMDLSAERTTEIDSALHGFGDASGALGSGSLLYGGSNPLKSIAVPTDSTSLQALVLGVRGPSMAVPSFLQGALGTTSIPGLGFFLDAFATSSDADILSTPHILATDNTQADIKVQLHTSLQRNAPSYSLPSTGAAGGAAAASLLPLTSPASANYTSIGPEIKVTPHLNESDDVRLDVIETISDLTGEPPQGTLGTINYVERSAATTLTVKDGHTAVIGGLVKNRVLHSATKVPLLGDIPVIGALFRSTKDEVAKDNLVLVLTPHIIRTEDDMRRIFEERMQERQEFLDHYFVFRDEQPVGFDPRRGHGLLFELRTSHRESDERHRLEAPPPDAAVAGHPTHPPLDLPGEHAAAQPTTLKVDPAPRGVEHVER